MKFLVITNHSYMLWQFRRELIEKLQTLGEVVISTPFVGHEEDLKGLGCRCIETDIDRRGINPITDLKLYRRFKQILKEEKPDIVITYSIKPNIYAGYCCRRLGIPYCVNVQGLGTAFQKKILASVVTFMYKTALKKAKVVFFENDANANEFIKRKIIREEKITVLKGAGVNLERYAFCEYPQNDIVHFLFVGRIMKEKGTEELFEAYKRISEEYPGMSILELAGFFEDEYKDAVEKLVEEKKAVFHGFVENVVPLYQAADCIVLPSYHEGMSNVLLESCAVGRPIITSDIPGCRESLDNGVNGFLCKPADAQSLYEAMKKFMDLSLQERKQMGIYGRQKTEKEFDKKAVVEKTAAEIIK